MKGITLLSTQERILPRENEPNNHRPITCLHLTWTLLTGIIADEIYGFLENEGLLPEKQKDCRRKSKGNKEQLHIDKMLLQEVKPMRPLTSA